jgi:hypothetical protein
MVKSMEIIKQIIDLGTASCLTQGAELGWFEYGRPGHPKGYNKPPQKTNVIELGKATRLTLGNGNSLFEGPDGRPARRN